MHSKMRHKSLGITKYRLYELRYFCLQYRQWKDKLRSRKLSQGERDRYSENVRLVDETVQETAADIAPYMLEAVTNEYASYTNLRGKGMPCGRKYYYEHRQRFYELLSSKKGDAGSTDRV